MFAALQASKTTININVKKTSIISFAILNNTICLFITLFLPVIVTRFAIQSGTSKSKLGSNFFTILKLIAFASLIKS